MTVNFSHGPDLGLVGGEEEEQKLLLHRDPQDKSYTLLFVYQDPLTPLPNRAHWVVELGGAEDPQVVDIGGGFMEIFDGRRHLHGVLPPIKFNPQFPWYGVTLVVKVGPKVKS